MAVWCREAMLRGGVLGWCEDVRGRTGCEQCVCEALCLTVVCVRVSVQWWLRGALAARGTAAVDAMRSVRISHVCVYVCVCACVSVCHAGLCGRQPLACG